MIGEPTEPWQRRAVDLFRAGDYLIVIPQSEPAPSTGTRPPRPDTVDAVLRVEEAGATSTRTMAVRLPRSLVADADPRQRPPGSAIRRTEGAHLFHLSALAPVHGAHGPNRVPAWLRTALSLVEFALPSVVRLRDIAGRHRVHPVHFSRTFKRCFGVTLSAFVMKRRLERAAEHVVLKNTSLAEISTDQGFADQSHLTRTFRTHVGITPARLRARAQQTRR